METREASIVSSRRTSLLKTGSTFLPAKRSDIIGIDHVLCEVDIIIHWLTNSDYYRQYNARLEPGVIFTGEPGTGKTLAARYLATTSSSRFINVRDWPTEEETISAGDLRDLFTGARRVYAEEGVPIVLFWDEFESHASDRDELSGKEADVVAQSTAELDGIHGKNDGILLIGCTNYIHSIDDALRRPGRMGLVLHFQAPDRAGRRALFEHYIADKPSRGLDFSALGRLLEPGMPASGIEEICAQIWTSAVRHSIENKKPPEIHQEEIVEILLQNLIGSRTAPIKDKDARRRVAIHEIGHCLVAYLLGVSVILTSVRPGGDSHGVTITDSLNEGLPERVSDWENNIMIALGGVICEKICQSEQLAGCDRDLNQATSMAYQLVDLIAIDQPGEPLSLSVLSARRQDVSEGQTLSEMSLSNSDQQIRLIIKDAYNRGEELLLSLGRDFIERLADKLNDEIILLGKDVDKEVKKFWRETPPDTPCDETLSSHE